MQIQDPQVYKLRAKEVASVKVHWRKQFVEYATWEAKEYMKKNIFICLNSKKMQTKAQNFF